MASIQIYTDQPHPTKKPYRKYYLLPRVIYQKLNEQPPVILCTQNEPQLQQSHRSENQLQDENSKKTPFDIPGKKQKKRKTNQSFLSDVQQQLEFSISIIHNLERKVEELERQKQILHLQTNMRTETSHINKSTVPEDKSTSLHSLNNHDINLRILSLENEIIKSRLLNLEMFQQVTVSQNLTNHISYRMTHNPISYSQQGIPQAMNYRFPSPGQFQCPQKVNNMLYQQLNPSTPHFLPNKAAYSTGTGRILSIRNSQDNRLKHRTNTERNNILDCRPNFKETFLQGKTFKVYSTKDAMAKETTA